MFRLYVPRLILGVAFLTAVAAWVSAQDGPEFPSDQASDSAGVGALPASGDLPQGVEALSRGPLHEAFAEPLTSQPSATLVITRQPPEPIDEVPPEVKPEEDAIWISGYWAWDDERNDFIWISGAWRVPPTDQRWVPGYWAQAASGYQWVPGFWTAADVQQVNYLPEPPATLEQGPSSPSPGDDYFYVPGNWTWREVNYGWTPGYWAHVQPNWLWVPAHYCWAPSGYVYVAGYWDYPLVRRGWLFSPVYFSSPIYTQPDFYYTPSVVVNTPLLAANLFVRPNCNWYYFGDYYDRGYASTYVPWFQYGRRTYDPIFTYQRWYHSSRNPNWYNDIQSQFALRQRDPSARPPRVVNINNTNISNTNVVNNNLALRLNQFVSQEGVRDRVTRLPNDQRQQFARAARELRQFQTQRERLELGNVAQRGRRGAQERVTLRLPTMDAATQQALRGRGREGISRTQIPDGNVRGGRSLNQRTQDQAQDAARALRQRERQRAISEGFGGDAIGDLDRAGNQREQANRLRREAQQRAEIDRARTNRQFDRDQSDLRDRAAEQSLRRRQLEQADDTRQRVRQFQRSQLDDDVQRARRSAAEQQRMNQLRGGDNLQRSRAMAEQRQQQERMQQLQQERMRNMRGEQESQRARAMQAQQQQQQMQQRRQQMEQMRANQDVQRARVQQQQQQQQQMQQRRQQMEQMRANQNMQRARESQRIQQQQQQQQQLQNQRRRQEVQRPVQQPAFQQRVNAVRESMRQPNAGSQFGRPQDNPEGRNRRGRPDPRQRGDVDPNSDAPIAQLESGTDNRAFSFAAGDRYRRLQDRWNQDKRVTDRYQDLMSANNSHAELPDRFGRIIDPPFSVAGGATGPGVNGSGIVERRRAEVQDNTGHGGIIDQTLARRSSVESTFGGRGTKRELTRPVNTFGPLPPSDGTVP